MILIRKGPPPAALTTYRLQPDTSVDPPRLARYDGPGFNEVKPDVRAALIAEQRGVCCYCTDRITGRTVDPVTGHIDEGTTKIEHRVPQRGPNGDATRTLDWTNLFGACLGEIHKPAGANVLHCDSAKGERPITLDPTNPAHIAALTYRNDGTLVSGQPVHQNEIDEVLRLNGADLVKRRQRAVDAVRRELNRKYPARSYPPAALQKRLDAYRNPRADHPPFVGFLCWWLERAARKAA